MTEPTNSPEWEAFVEETARSFRYPPTPKIAAKLRPRSIAARFSVGWAALIALVLLIGTVPQVRAAVLEVLRVGAVTLFRIEPTQTPTPAATLTPPPQMWESVLAFPSQFETTLDAAREEVDFAILLPSELGTPDRVFIQDLGGWVVTLVWLAPDGEVYASLQMLDENASAGKYFPYQETTAQVNGQFAAWLEQTHTLEFYDGHTDTIFGRRIVEQNVLIWHSGAVSYRLESDLSLEEAVRIAESLE